MIGFVFVAVVMVVLVAILAAVVVAVVVVVVVLVVVAVPSPHHSLSSSYSLGSAYIRDLATLVVAYGISINLVEVTWKSKLKAAFPDPNAYSAFMGNFSTATGIVTLCLMLMVGFIYLFFTTLFIDHYYPILLVHLYIESILYYHSFRVSLVCCTSP